MWKNWLESFLEEHYSNPRLEFKDVMAYFRFSKSHGCALFKEHLGKTFRQGLRDVRMEKAKPLIEETPLPIREVSRRCGFRSPQRFNEAFKRMYGISPGAQRKNGNGRKILDI